MKKHIISTRVEENGIRVPIDVAALKLLHILTNM